MNCVVQVGINGKAECEREAVAKESPLGPIFHNQDQDADYDHDRKNSLDVADENLGHLPLRLEEEKGLSCQVNHGAEKKECQEFLDPQPEN
jgi:hypothetical protein